MKKVYILIVTGVVFIGLVGIILWKTHHRSVETTVVVEVPKIETKGHVGFSSRKPVPGKERGTSESVSKKINGENPNSEEHLLLEEGSSENPLNIVHEEQIDAEDISTNAHDVSTLTEEDSEEQQLIEAEEHLIAQVDSWLSDADKLVIRLEEINQSIDATRTSEGNLTEHSLPLLELKREYEEEAHNLLTLLWDEEIKNYLGELPREASRSLDELVNPPPSPSATMIELPSWVLGDPEALEPYLREQLGIRSSEE